MTARKYSSTAQATVLTSGVTAGGLTLAVGGVSGFPGSFPYTLILDRGLPTQEIVEVTAVSSLNLTVTRAVDGSTAYAHTLGAAVEHGVSARDYAEPNTHIAASTGQHGLLGGESPIKSTHTHDATGVGGPAIPFANVTGLSTHDHSGAAGHGPAVPFANVTGLATHDHSAATGHGPNIAVANITGGIGSGTLASPRVGAASGNPSISSGSAVLTTDANGRASLGIGTFASGLVAFICSNGDSNGRGGYPALDTSTPPTLSGVKVRWFDTDGSHPSGALVRVDWIAVGY